jgi:hypothetical protein
VAPVWSKLVNTGNGDIVAGYDDDGVHPNAIGHYLIAEAFVEAWRQVPKADIHPVSSISTYNLVTNPLGAGTLGAELRPTGWYEQPGGTGTAPTYEVAVKSGNLRYGQWGKMSFDAVSGGTRYMVLPCSATGWAVGDVLVVAARLEFTDVGGTYRDAAWIASPTANVSLRVVNQSFAIIASPLTNSVATPGPILASFTVPSGATELAIALQMVLPTGAHVTAQLGEVGLFNATALGVSSLV